MQFIAAVTIVVPDYGQAPAFYVGKLGFTLVEDTKISDEKRWVLVSPPGSRKSDFSSLNLHLKSRKMRMEVKLAGAFFCSYKLMILKQTLIR